MISTGELMRKSLMAILKTQVQQAVSLQEPREFLDLSVNPSVFYADKYPEVPKPEPKTSPIVLAAQWACHDLYGGDMPSIAADLMEFGYDTPSLRRLAGEMRVACSADVEELVGRMFRELSVPDPISEIEAKIIITRQFARGVIHGNCNAWVAARFLSWRELSWRSEIPDLWTIYVLVEEFESENGQPTTTLTEELLDTFAKLAVLKDEESQNVSA
jgi:hypothetical protein